MNYTQIYSIANQGMRVEKLRVNVVANNIANQHSLGNADGSTFQTNHVISTAKPFAQLLNSTTEMGIATVAVVPQNLPANKVYQPEHPAADKQGYVNYPGISTVDEMTTLLRASRAYEANIKIINSAHSLYLQALTIGEER